LILNTGASNVANCSLDVAGDVVCTNDVFVSWNVTNNGGSTVAPVRDVLNAATFTGEPLTITTATLMEAFLPDGSVVPRFTGSDTVVPAGQVADIIHVGAAGLGPPAAANAQPLSTTGSGNDLVIGSTGSISVTGGNGDDTLIGSSAHDVLDGGGGNDTVRGGFGADDLRPGGGFADVLSYDDAGRGAALVATFTPDLAFTANPDGDAVGLGFDGLEGTPLGDSLTSTAGAILRGAEGDDLLQGGPGSDTFDGGDGNDNIQAADGLAETVDCGAGVDITFSVDPTDTVTNCEGLPPAAAPPPAGAAPTTGATTTGVPVSSKTAAPSLPPIGATLSSKFSLSGASTRVTTLTAKKLPANSSLTITCTAPKGKSSACAFKTKTKSFKKKTDSSALASLFKKKKLPAGTKIVVRITAPGKAGKTFTFTTRKNKKPTLVTA
jgi:hypothetical protein